MSDNILNVSLVTLDSSVQELNQNTTLIVDEFSSSESGVIKSGVYFTDTGLVGGTPDRIRFYNNIDAVAVDFETGSEVYKAAQVVFSQNPRPSEIAIGRKDSADTSYQSALTAISTANDGFYFVMTVSADEADIKEVAAWSNARTKFHVGKTADAAVKTSAIDDVASDLKTLSYHRTALVYHNVNDTDGDLEAADAGICAKLATDVPGKSTLMFKTLTGVSADNITPTEINYIKGKNCNVYTTKFGKNIVRNGVCSSGRFADTQIYMDYLKNQVENEIFTLLYNEANAGRKVDFTDVGGLSQLKNVLIKVFEKELQKKALATWTETISGEEITFRYKIEELPVASVPTNEKNAREYKYLSFTVQYSSAIHELDPITGYLYT